MKKAVNLTTNPFSVGIKGMGYYIPSKIVTNKDLETMVETTDEWIQKKIGIKERHICDATEAASDLAYKAAIKAIAQANIDVTEIDLIIMTTLQPDYTDPQPASLLKYMLGAKNAAAFNMSVGGCPDSIFGFISAANFVLSGFYKNVLLVNAEVNSKFINWNDRNMCVFFGDGSGAWILSPVKAEKGLLGYYWNNDGSGHDVIQVKAGGSRMPTTRETLEKGFNYPKMDGKKVFKFATTVFPESINTLLDALKINKDEVTLFLSHQANINIIKDSLAKLNVDFSKTYTNIDKYGNMSSASVPVVLAEALEKKLIKANDIITLSAFGAGLAWGSVAIKWPQKEDFL